MSTVLYGAEAWTCGQADYQNLNVFHTKRLRIMSRTEINNKNLFKLTKMHELEMYIRKARLRWAGHVRRVQDARIPKMLISLKEKPSQEVVKRKTGSTAYEKILRN